MTQGRAMDRPQMDRGRHARRACGQSNAGGMTRKGAREKGKTDVFLFLGERSEEYLFCPPGGSRGKAAAIAALGYRRRRENNACADCAENPACGGLWPPFQLIYLRYLCGSAEREERMDVCFLLTLYIQYITKFGGCQKWKVEENGRDGKFWKARDCGRWIRGKGCVGRNGREIRWLPPNIFFLTFLWFYGILTVFSRESRKRGTENARIR